MSVVCGVDPGLKGGIAFLEYGEVLHAAVMPVKRSARGKGDVNANALYDMVLSYCPIDLVVVEQVHALPKQGIASTFNFGRGVGKVMAILEVLGLSIEEPTPQAWKKVVLAGTDRSKEACVGWVQQRFPQAPLVPQGCRVPSDGICDAIALAEYGRRLLTGVVGR